MNYFVAVPLTLLCNMSWDILHYSYHLTIKMLCNIPARWYNFLWQHTRSFLSCLSMNPKLKISLKSISQKLRLQCFMPDCASLLLLPVWKSDCHLNLITGWVTLSSNNWWLSIEDNWQWFFHSAVEECWPTHLCMIVVMNFIKNSNPFRNALLMTWLVK